MKTEARKDVIYVFNVKNAVFNSMCCVMEYTICSRVIGVHLEIGCLGTVVTGKPILPVPVCR
jgi:hypothetical protein